MSRNHLQYLGKSMKCNEARCPPEEEQIDSSTRLVDKLPSDKDLYQDAELLKALSDVTRLKIVHLLQEGELCVCEIMHSLDKPQSTVSHHLNILKNAGLIKWRKEGIWIHYQLSSPGILGYIRELTRTIPD